MKPTTLNQGHKERGFTLIEIMVVLVILGLLVAIVGPNILGRGDQARVTAAEAQLSNIASALDLYRLDNSHYPSTQQGLDALQSKPSGSPEPRNWNPDGYLSPVPQDPWGWCARVPSTWGSTSAPAPKAPMTSTLSALTARKAAKATRLTSVPGMLKGK